MNFSELAQALRDDTGVTAANVTDTLMARLLNRGRRKAINFIRECDKMYFYNEYTFDIVANQIEYTLQKRTSSVPWMVEILNVAIKYTANDTEYTPLKLTNDTYPRDMDFMRDNLAVRGYKVADNSVFIYNAPNVNITAGGKYGVILDYPDITTSSTEDDMKIPLVAHELMIAFTKPLIYENRKLWNEKTIAENDLEKAKEEARKAIDRTKWPMYSEMPNLSHLE